MEVPLADALHIGPIAALDNCPGGAAGPRAAGRQTRPDPSRELREDVRAARVVERVAEISVTPIEESVDFETALVPALERGADMSRTTTMGP